MSYQQHRGKQFFIVLILTALFALGGYGASYFSKQFWRAEAEIVAPTTNELGNYYSLFSIYQLISGEKAAASESSKRVFHEFQRQLAAYDNISGFWQNSALYKQQVTGNTQNDGMLLDELVRRVSFSRETPESAAKISLESDNPKQAVELLLGLMEYTNYVTRSVVYNELIAQWKDLFNQVNSATQLKSGQQADAQDWQGKLNMMKSVSALDNNLIAYRYMKKPMLPIYATYPDRYLWAVIGGAGGLVFGLLLILLFPSKRKES
ncbi:chain-length determining protein [Caviibacterium pharyngocola]|uniref:Chain-length determining protein n=1 Tax=Caviibacterium pharyngocola TaxID=28159 RepID=A0A2M8RZB2_9PAST|nr:chain-length determining protein [Caviibacterium pharyngocola]PJG84204.1 chain-length determining protein [Caviibacterium pharyngocola]